MTTKILIVNYGPDDVVVRQSSPAALEPFDRALITDTNIPAGTHGVFFVHVYQQIRIKEERGET